MLAALVLVPILWFVEDGVWSQEVELPDPEGLQGGAPDFDWLVCVREFESTDIRCYALHRETKEVRFADYELTEESTQQRTDP